MKSEKKRYIWLDILKIIACFCVIINHAGGYIFEYWGHNKCTVLFYSFFFSICKIGVPIFLMATGYLLIKKDYKYKDACKSIIRILIPLLALSFLTYYIEGANLKKFIFDFLESPIIIPYWYLYMMIGVYLLMPLISKMIKKFEIYDYKYLIIVCLIIPGFIPIIEKILNITISKYFTLGLLSTTISYIIAGIYLGKISLNKRNKNIAIISIIISIIAYIISLYVPFIINKKFSITFDSWNNIITILPSLSLFYLIRYYFEDKNENKIIPKISKLTFGIYLFHYILIYKIYNISITQSVFKFNPYFGVIILEILCFTISGVITYILQKIPIIKSFL